MAEHTFSWTDELKAIIDLQKRGEEVVKDQLKPTIREMVHMINTFSTYPYVTSNASKKAVSDPREFLRTYPADIEKFNGNYAVYIQYLQGYDSVKYVVSMLDNSDYTMMILQAILDHWDEVGDKLGLPRSIEF